MLHVTGVASASLSSPPISTPCSEQTESKTADIELTPASGLCSSEAQPADDLICWR